MLESKEMKRFMELPKEFRYGIEREIEKVLDEYAGIRGKVRAYLECVGDENAYKEACYYDEYAGLVTTLKERVVVAEMKAEYCKEEKKYEYET